MFTLSKGHTSLVGKIVNDWLDDNSQEAEAIVYWLYAVLSRSMEDSLRLGEACEICGSKSNLERHHLAGQKHCFLTITACFGCHRILTEEQKTWDSRWLLEDQPPEIREAFLLLGVRDALRLCAQKRECSSYRSLAGHFTEDIAKRLRGDKK